jgi:NAD(P)-dependent dehydrogenase (short-subunit alcohol dehydrogenase family)
LHDAGERLKVSETPTRGTALVTGAGLRIGAEVARALGRDGWTVAVHYRTSDRDAAQTVAAVVEAGGRAASFAGDLRQPDAAGRLIETVSGELGPVTCLINNAARFEYDEAHTMTVADWDAHMEINVRAPVFLAQAFAAKLPDDLDGNIINLIDERVWKLVPTHFSYTVSKAAFWAATQMLAQAFAPRIRVNAIGPGPTVQSRQQNAEEFASENRKMLLGHGTTPQEIAAAVNFILAAPAMTGQMIALDGGQHLLWQTRDMNGTGFEHQGAPGGREEGTS